MLYMVIEQLKDAHAVGERFARLGRMLPEGVEYHASWVDPAQGRCFQLMEAADREAIQRWANQWKDLIDFEIVPVVSSTEFWANRSESRS
jgi:hypothetical protein